MGRGVVGGRVAGREGKECWRGRGVGAGRVVVGEEWGQGKKGGGREGSGGWKCRWGRGRGVGAWKRVVEREGVGPGKRVLGRRQLEESEGKGKV